MKRLAILIFCILLSCSKDSPVPDAVVTTPEPTATTFTLVVTSSEGGSVNDPGDTHNENTNVSVTATPAQGYSFSGWTGDATGSTNPLSVSMTQNKNITANFIRTKYLLNIGTEGEGGVTQEVISTAKTSDEYNSGTLVRLSATPSENWLFYAWNDGSTGFIDAATGLAEAEELNYTNPRDITIDRSINVTATFERIIEEEDFPTGAVGKWKIKRPKSASKTDDTKANKSAMAECGLTEIIFRTDGSFAMVTSTTTFTGQYSFEGNTNIILTQVEAPFGAITNLIISDGSILFSINLVDGCSDNAEGNRDQTYDEATDTSYPPVISLVGSSEIYIEVGETFTDPGATASDNLDGDLTSSITSSGTVDTATEGTYTIVYSASDTDGNIAFVLRTVIVSLDLPPTISLTGSATIILKVGDEYIEDGCVATDNEDGDITSSITTSGTVDTSIAGTYTVVYSVTDSSDNSASVSREVVVNTLDTTAPIITLIGSSTINLTVGDTFTDPGATATDDVDGNITSAITISGAVNTFTAGTYTILYSVSDAAGNNATVVQRTVIINVVVASIYFENNTCKCPNATVGDTAVINGVTYTAVDDNSIAGQIANGNVNLCTTLVTDMGVDTSEPEATNFFKDNSFNQNISFWDTSNVTNMMSMFLKTTEFNGDLGNWDTSNVISMEGMFLESSFNNDIGNWNTSNVKNMFVMFALTSNFNQDIGNWDTSSVTNMESMFFEATAFNQDLTNWCVTNFTSEPQTFTQDSALTDANKPVWGTCPDGTSTTSDKIYFENGTCKCPEATVGDTSVINGVTYTVVDDSTIKDQFANNNFNLCTTLVTDMEGDFPDNNFFGDNSFNYDIGFWDTSNVTNMNFVFIASSEFNQDISSWNLSSVVQMGHMFDGATSFNQDIGSWKIPNALTVRYMFANSNFNRDIGSWDTSSVNDMQGMFYNAKVFNQNIGNWNTSNVTVLEHMFLFAESFNQPIGNWDVSSVTNMNGMFGGATNFNQDLTNWCVSNFQSEPDDEFSNGSALTEDNKPIWGTCPSN